MKKISERIWRGWKFQRIASREQNNILKSQEIKELYSSFIPCNELLSFGGFAGFFAPLLFRLDP